MRNFEKVSTKLSLSPKNIANSCEKPVKLPVYICIEAMSKLLGSSNDLTIHLSFGQCAMVLHHIVQPYCDYGAIIMR